VNFYHLQTFLVVAKREGISKALDELPLTQSAVSRQILALEEALGVQLFVRKRRSLVLTEAGQILREYAMRAFQVLSEAREAIDGLKGLVRGHLRISAASTIGIYMLPEVLGKFKTHYPGIEISLSITNKEQVLRHLLAAASDIGFVGPPVLFHELATEEYMEDELVLIVSPQHRLSNREIVTAQELAEEVFILREKGSGTREIMEEELRRAGIALRHAMELGSTEAVKQAVAANLGVSIVSTDAVTQEVLLGRLCTVRIANLNLRRCLFLVYPKKLPLSPAAKEFRRFLLEQQTTETGNRSQAIIPTKRADHTPPTRRRAARGGP
jgi:DNA-binding transcriptional LysR family regulator